VFQFVAFDTGRHGSPGSTYCFGRAYRSILGGKHPAALGQSAHRSGARSGIRWAPEPSPRCSAIAAPMTKRCCSLWSATGIRKRLTIRSLTVLLVSGQIAAVIANAQASPCGLATAAGPSNWKRATQHGNRPGRGVATAVTARQRAADLTKQLLAYAGKGQFAKHVQLRLNLGRICRGWR
jgi:hypothetical protein